MTTHRKRHRPRDRRGVLILIVLSMLIIFLMIAVAFVLIASQQSQAAKAASRDQQTDDPPQALLDGAMYQLLRDTQNLHSAVRGHSLLRDIYGDDSVHGIVQDAALIPTTGDQFVNVEIVATSGVLSSIDNYYSGRLLTFTNGPLHGVSTRIIRYASDTGVFTIMRPDTDDSLSEALATILAGLQTATPSIYPVVINGRPFNGTGFGYNPATGKVDAVDNWVPILGNAQLALLPNHIGVDYTAEPRYLAGGADESYDAADYQNIALAYSERNVFDTDSTNPTPTLRSENPRIVPSFHRPALVNYWYHLITDPAVADVIFARYVGVGNPFWPEAFGVEEKWAAILAPNVGFSGDTDRARAIIDLKRKINLRPLREDHPNFTGSNPSASTPQGLFTDTSTSEPFSYREMVGPWDVDNDGDGVRDSVWVDLGYPVTRAADGRLYKPLFAILCQDLDGRLNLNAHGSLEHTSATFPPDFMTLAGGKFSNELPRGQGYGPAEISLAPLFQSSPDDYRTLLVGKGTYGGRYGTSLVPGYFGQDRRSDIKFFEYPDTLDPTIPTAFGSPPDLNGRYGLGLDPRGTPAYEQLTVGGLFENNPRTNTPYELDLSLGGPRGDGLASAGDMAFSVAELERLLRPYDVDAGALPDRLLLLAPSLALPGARQLVTTESYDLSVPNMLAPSDLVFLGPDGDPDSGDEYIVVIGRPATNLHITDLLRYRLMEEQNLVAPLNVNDALRINGQTAAMLPPELISGGWMDINRPFGNALDDDNDGVVDEPDEGIVNGVDDDRDGDIDELDELQQFLWEGPFGAGSVLFVPYDADANGTNDEIDYLLQRQLYARHLYVLAMLLTNASVTADDGGYLHPTLLPGLTKDEKRRLTARRIAQWAVNAVDFRDADAIMTPFEYDENPFDGWHTDGFVDTTNDPIYGGDGPGGAIDTGGVVWGCERPELLITETVAWHDRRTQDRADDVGGEKYTAGHVPADNDNTDDDFDQRFRPWGRAFIELYNPNPVGQMAPAEFYGASIGLELDMRTPGNVSPVWRMLVVRGDSRREGRDPDNRVPVAGDAFSITDVERSIYFTEPTSDGNEITGHGRAFYSTNNTPPVEPGRYAVVGSSGISRVGNRNDGDPNTEAQLIRLFTDEFDVFKMDTNSAIPAVVRPVVPVPIGNAWDTASAARVDRNFSISEPAGGYGSVRVLPVGVVWNPGVAGREGQYEVDDGNGNPTGALRPLDKPLDSDRSDIVGDIDDEAAFLINGTKLNYRTIHLQRLANPLIDWHPLINPYLTVDTASFNLTVFNGVESPAHEGANDGAKFVAIQRGERNDPGKVNLWQVEPTTDLPGDDATFLAGHFFGFQLHHTLGYLNEDFDDGNFLVPRVPFPWLTWNNRPYVSQYELMLVPTSSSSRLFYEFALVVLNDKPYEVGRDEQEEFDFVRAPFGHLFNFFQTSETGNDSANFYRLLEFTHVPSRFVGTETVLNPAFFSGAFPGTEMLHPPFNMISNYRVPGTVNVNTIVSNLVWNGLMHTETNPHPGPSWNNFVASRRGYNAVGTGNLIFDNLNLMPTFFANPVRSPAAAKHVPLAAMERPDVNTTLLRSESNVGSTLGSKPLFGASTKDAHNHSDRNPYFRYQGMQRLANLVTTRSNVYATWITVGYFEVNSVGQLQQELGTDTGQIERHRGFYIIDRSIPVAFEPGKNHNVDRAVILRRFIE